MRNVTTGDLVDSLILSAKLAEKNRIISSLHPTAANCQATRVADRKLRNAREALNRHFTSVVKEAERLMTLAEARKRLRMKDNSGPDITWKGSMPSDRKSKR